MMKRATPLWLVAASLLAQEPTDYRGWFDRAAAQYRANRFAEAAQSFEKAVALDPSNTQAHLYLGTCWLRQYVPGANTPANAKAAARAEEEFRRALDLDARNTVAITSLASLALREKKWDDSQKWYEKLTALEPNNAEAWYSLGLIAWSKVDPALRAARAASGMQPGDPGPIRDAAIRHKTKDEYGALLTGGIQSLGRALGIRSESEEAMTQLGMLLRARADLRDNAIEYMQDIKASDEWAERARQMVQEKVQRAASMTQPIITPAPGGVSNRIRIGEDVMEAKLLHRVAPAAGSTKGTVVLNIVVDRQGRVREAKPTSGAAELAPLAIDAVKQWVYQPTQANGIPVEVETAVTIEF
jgi:Gram-negative bacterial TonB protein C-terminal/Tetratricopeptide repeat